MKHPTRWLVAVGVAVAIGAGAGATVACACDTRVFGEGPEIPHTFSCYGPDTSGCWTPNACTVTAETSDTTDLQAKLDAADPGDTVCGAGTYGAISILNKDNASDITLQSTDPNDPMIIDPLTIRSSDHWTFQGLHLQDVEPWADTNITFRHNLHTNGQFVYAPTTNCNPPDPPYVSNANNLISHSEFTDFNEYSGGLEGRITVCGGGEGDPLGLTVSDNWFHKGAKSTADLSSCSDGIGAYGATVTGLVIEYNEFSDMAQGACTTFFPVQQPHVDPIAPSGMDFGVIHGNWFHSMIDGSGGILSGPVTGMVVEQNVFDCSCVYPYSLVMFSTMDWQVKHNTFANGGLLYSEANEANPCPAGNVVIDNIFINNGLYTPQDPATCAWSLNSNSHNLNSGKAGTGELTGTPRYVGGPNSSTYCGFVTDPDSPAYHTGSDGSSMGITPPNTVCD